MQRSVKVTKRALENRNESVWVCVCLCAATLFQLTAEDEPLAASLLLWDAAPALKTARPCRRRKVLRHISLFDGPVQEQPKTKTTALWASLSLRSDDLLLRRRNVSFSKSGDRWQLPHLKQTLNLLLKRQVVKATHHDRICSSAIRPPWDVLPPRFRRSSSHRALVSFVLHVFSSLRTPRGPRSLSHRVFCLEINALSLDWNITWKRWCCSRRSCQVFYSKHVCLKVTISKTFS